MLKTNPLVYRLNSYFAVLIITIVGSAATLLIVRVANSTDTLEAQSVQALDYNATAP